MKPTETAEWASGASRRLEPSSGEKADGFVEGTRTPARKGNWIIGVLSDWANWVEDLFDSDGQHAFRTGLIRQRVIAPNGGRPLAGTWNEDGTAQDRVYSQTNFAMWSFDIGAYLPSGAVLQNIEVLLQQGGSRTGINRAGCRFGSSSVNALWAAPASPTFNDFIEYAGESTTAWEVVDLSNNAAWSNLTIDNQLSQYTLIIQAGSDGAHVSDQIGSIRITYTDVGLRNH